MKFIWLSTFHQIASYLESPTLSISHNEGITKIPHKWIKDKFIEFSIKDPATRYLSDLFTINQNLLNVLEEIERCASQPQKLKLKQGFLDELRKQKKARDNSTLEQAQSSIHHLLVDLLKDATLPSFIAIIETPERYEEKAKNCINFHLVRFFDYQIALQEAQFEPKIDTTGKVKFNRFPFLRRKPIIGNRIPKATREENYLAYYLISPEKPTIGYVTLTWGEDERGEWPLDATLEQLPKNEDEPNIIFDSINEIEFIPKDNSALLYIQLKGTFQIQGKKQDSVFQCIIDTPTGKPKTDRITTEEENQKQRRLLSGTFSSIRGTSKMSPSAGCVLLQVGSYNDFRKIRQYIFDEKTGSIDDPGIQNYLSASYFLSDKLLINPSIPNTIEKLPTHRNWQRLQSTFVGVYSGELILDAENETTFKEHFVLEIDTQGQCKLYFKIDIKKPKEGRVRVDGDLLYFRFKIDFEFKINFIKEQKRQTGIFSGIITTIYTPPKVSNSGFIMLEKIDCSIDEAIKLVSSTLISLTDRTILADYLAIIEDPYRRIPDQKIFRKIIESQNPILINDHKKLVDLELPLHLKYLTFRIPTKSYDPNNPETMFRLEKCDLKFSEDYKEVSMESKLGFYFGKVYFNGKVMLMILNPVNTDLSLRQTDNYFTIQVDLSDLATNRVTNPNVLFGTSTWRGEKYLESKMVALVKPEDGDESVDVFKIDPYSDSFKKDIETLNNEDLKMLGGYAYLSGRLNRHIHVYSGSGKRDVFRPRDMSSREPFIFAALYLANILDTLKSDALKKGTPKETDSKEHKDIRDKAVNYFLEGLLHQYGSNYFCGEPLNSENIKKFSTHKHKPVFERLSQILDEQQDLIIAFKGIEDKPLKEEMKKLWPYLKD